MGAEDQLRRAADALEHHARGLSRLLDGVAGWSGLDTWVGGAADRFRDDLHHHQASLSVAEQELLATASRLRAKASTMSPGP